MNKLFVLITFLALTTLFAYSCKKDPVIHRDSGYGYYPSTPGHFVIYDADSTVYDSFRKDTVIYKYQMKEFCESVFTDNEGRPSVRLERYIRPFNPNKPYDSLAWILKNVWYSTLTPVRAERMEGNQRFIKMIFPVKNGAYWNGNAQNTLGDWEYKYTDVNTPSVFGGLSFDSTATIIQKDDTDLLNRRYYKEVYAKDAGLVYKEVLDVYDTKIDTVPVVKRIKGGVSFNMTIHSWGKQ